MFLQESMADMVHQTQRRTKHSLMAPLKDSYADSLSEGYTLCMGVFKDPKIDDAPYTYGFP